MIIRKIKLQNIRSYLDQVIEFPEGSILLAGNIGAGKSSILLAIDFALFGLQKGNITGSSLLRNDSKKGSIELEFDIDDRNIIIKRGLKREGDKIIQDAGSLVINNDKQSLTALELKQKILQLLNYPRELITKSKSLIYRYTVYTPQEEMKHILQVEKDIRLDILRKIFGIDKYKRIKENSKIFVTNLKEKKKEFLGYISDLEAKENLKLETDKKIKEKENFINKLVPRLSNINEVIQIKKNKLKDIEDNIKKLNKLKQELIKNETELKNKIERKKSNLEEIKLLEKETSEFREKKFNAEEINKKLNEKEDSIKNIEKEIKELTLRISEFRIARNNSEKLKQDILKLDNCPTCKQQVSEKHKESINKEENKKINNYEENIELLNKKLEEKDSEFIDMKKDTDFLNKEMQEYNVYRVRLENFREKKKRFESLMQELVNIRKEIDKLEEHNKKLTEDIDNFDNLEKQYDIIKKELDDSSKEQRSIEIEKIGFEKEMGSLKENLLGLDKEIKNKLETREKLNKYVELQSWFESDFIELIDNMERQIMFKIYHDFNSLFQKWFGMLIDNEILTIKLDNEFTPVIQQNNYDIDYEHISGGERTAAALAYRLALNQVINNLITNIKTKDLLILDEPTDGFSSEQLDRLRSVLEELNIKQTIIVSHDPKIESFVDNVIRVSKKEHVSSTS